MLPQRYPPLKAHAPQYEAVQLFIQRAVAVKPAFAMTNDNAPAVAEICSRLDGLPLAIELAAARVKLFPPQALLQWLQSRLTLLTGGAKDKPARQQTLRSTVDWSYSLLADEEQTLFARLATFTGGCTFEAAGMVCNATGDIDVLEGMTSLIDKSLVRQEGEDEPRFSMLETIREYAAEKLAERAEHEKVRAAHAEYYLQLCEDAEAELRGPNQGAWMERLDAEVPNLWVAVRFFLETHRLSEAIRTLSLYDYWIHRPHWEEAMRWLGQALQQVDDTVPPGIHGKGLWAFAAVSGWVYIGVPERNRPLLPYLERAIALLRDSDEPFIYARALTMFGNVLRTMGDYEEATRQYEQGLEAFRAVGDQRGIGIVLQNLGAVAVDRHDDEAALRYYEEALALLRAANDGNALAVHLMLLCTLYVTRGELAAARTCIDEAVQISEARRHRVWAGLCHHVLGVVAMKEGRPVNVRDHWREAVACF